MRIPRFYISTSVTVGESVELPDTVFRHAIQVLRLKVDEPLILFNSLGGEYHAEIAEINKRSATVKITKHDNVSRESNLKIELVLALIKPDRMDWAIQKAVELGVTSIQPISTERSVIKLKDKRLKKKLGHWQGIIISACEQSGRTAMPTIQEPMALTNYLEKKNGETLQLVMLPNSPSVKELTVEDINSLSLLIGPEGGWTPQEQTLLASSNTTPASWGKRILRAETAVVAGITSCQQIWGDY